MRVPAGRPARPGRPRTGRRRAGRSGGHLGAGYLREDLRPVALAVGLVVADADARVVVDQVGVVAGRRDPGRDHLGVGVALGHVLARPRPPLGDLLRVARVVAHLAVLPLLVRPGRGDLVECGVAHLAVAARRRSGPGWSARRPTAVIWATVRDAAAGDAGRGRDALGERGVTGEEVAAVRARRSRGEDDDRGEKARARALTMRVHVGTPGDNAGRGNATSAGSQLPHAARRYGRATAPTVPFRVSDRRFIARVSPADHPPADRGPLDYAEQLLQPLDALGDVSSPSA